MQHNQQGGTLSLGHVQVRQQIVRAIILHHPSNRCRKVWVGFHPWRIAGFQGFQALDALK